MESYDAEVRFTSFDGTKTVTKIAGCKTPEEAWRKLMQTAKETDGWTPPKWWQWWRWEDYPRKDMTPCA